MSASGERQRAQLNALLDEAVHERTLRRLLWGIVAVVLLAVAWSILAQVDELTQARAEVQPIQRVQVVQSKEGGVLEAILVQVGDAVKPGQVIARFGASDVERDRVQVDVRRDALRIDLERWAALAEGRQPDFSAFAHRPKLVEEARALFAQQEQGGGSQLSARRNAVRQQEANLQGVRMQLPAAEEALRSANDVLNRYQEGVRQGVVSRIRLSEAQEHASETRRNLSALQAQAVELESAVARLRNEEAQARQGFVEQARTKRSELLEKVQELDADARVVTSRQGRIEVASPVAGYIKQLPDTRVGAVIPPGGTVAEIVPSEGGVVLEALVPPRDIGFVRAGQAALVKVDAYDYSRFGAVRGTVKRVSPTAFKVESTGQSFYKVDVAVEQAHVGQDRNKALIPGMSAEVDIVTGRKSVFQYLAKPVFLGADTAFHER